MARVLGDRSFDASLAWSNPECAPAFITRGPSKLTGRHLFRVASLTKTYVAVLALSMVEKGELSLDERVDARFPDAPESMRAVTVRQLLQHTGGIFNYSDAEAFFQAIDAEPRRVWTPEELIGLALTESPYGSRASSGATEHRVHRPQVDPRRLGTRRWRASSAIASSRRTS